VTTLASKRCRCFLTAGAGLLSIVFAASVAAQERQEPALRSVGRGAPVSAPLYAVPTNPAEMPAFFAKLRQGSKMVGPTQFPADPRDPTSQPFFVGSEKTAMCLPA
jgi:hypothetical protein